MEMERIREYLQKHQSATAHEIAKALGLPKGQVNSILYANPAFTKSEATPPKWSLLTLLSSSAPTSSASNNVDAAPNFTVPLLSSSDASQPLLQVNHSHAVCAD
jgi:hypothetical protein